MAFNLFIDTNVYLDVLLERGNEWQDAKSIFELAEAGKIAFLITLCVIFVHDCEHSA